MSETIVANKYRLSRELGRGGMGSVHAAIHIGTGKRVAVKLMKANNANDAAERARVLRFQREALAVGRLATEHVVQVHDAGVDEKTGEPFIVMELLDGEDVSQLLRRLGPLPLPLAAAIVAQACMGLEKAHDAGVIHRDLKPSNLFLTKNEYGEYIVKILDFGIAKVSRGADDASEAAGTITETGVLVGSPHYMSPEQAKALKTIDHRSDLWSIGVVLHKCLSGRTPWDGNTTLGQVIVAICSEDPASIQDQAPWVPPDVSLLLRRALRRDPAMRFQTAAEVVVALKAFLTLGLPRITPEMLIPLSFEERGEVATRLSDYPTLSTPSSMRKPPVIPVELEELSANASSSVINNAVARSAHLVDAPTLVDPPASASVKTDSSFVTPSSLRQPGKRRARRAFATAVAGAALLAAMFVGWRQLGGRRSAGTASFGTASSVRAPASTNAPASLLGQIESAPVDASTRSRHDRVKVGPAGVNVEVDGKSVVVTAGTIAVEGPPGSVHRVRLSLGGRESSTDVVLTEKGAIPAELTLAASPESSTKPSVRAATRPPLAPSPPSKLTPSAPARAAGSFDQRFE